MQCNRSKSGYLSFVTQTGGIHMADEEQGPEEHPSVNDPDGGSDAPGVPNTRTDEEGKPVLTEH
jgi:hypothetical protein